MEIKIKEAKVLKEGDSAKGHWKLVKVVTDSDVEYTTFHAGAANLAPGTVIKIDKVKLEEKNGKEQRSFGEYEIVSSPVSSPAPVNGGRKGMTPEAWAEKDRLERWSIESQVAYKGIIELRKEVYLGTEMRTREGNVVPIDEKFKLAFNAALDWAMTHLQATNPPSQSTTKMPPECTESKSTPAKSETKPVFKNGADLVNYAIKQGIKWDDIQEKLSISKPPEITDLDGSYKILFGGKDEKVATEKENPDDPDGIFEPEDIPY